MSKGLIGRLLRSLTDHARPDSAAARFRKKRFASFSALLDQLPRPVRILDIGGDLKSWVDNAIFSLDQVEPTVLNLQHQPGGIPQIRQIQADARYLPFLRDCSFDVVFSNSVIEHVGSAQDQAKMAIEIQRIGKRYFIQTPSLWFPLEPHFLFPAFQFLPFSWRMWIAGHYKAGWYCHPGDPVAARREVASIRLLTRNDCRRLFPGAEVRTERLFGLAKSYIILGGWANKSRR
jgi:SAM-dependent methyltransferase